MIRIGHRGAAGYEPENTLRSFRKALELKADFIELDAQVCKTGEVLVIHDEKVDRTTNGRGYVAELSFDAIRALDAGKGEKVPTLEEVLDLAAGKARINVELKSRGAAEAVFNILDCYAREKNRPWDDFLISAFDHYDLARFRELNPAARLGAIISGIPIGYAECAEKVRAYSIHPSKEFISPEFVDDAHKRGIKVFVFTVNAEDDIRRMRELGVDGMFSDFPDRI